MKKNLVILSGAGMSAESGIKTFRASDGLWENHRIEDVATPEAFRRNPALVLEFYNQRRRQLLTAEPNAAHLAIARLQDKYDVQVITQNIDDLHERAGSKDVLHLHGEIMLARSTTNESDLYPIRGGELNMGDTCRNGSQLRPHIVWFGESVPLIEEAQEITVKADFFIVIGTSLSVYPAAGLIYSAPPQIPKYLIDPGSFELENYANLHHIKQNAVAGIQELTTQLQMHK